MKVTIDTMRIVFLWEPRPGYFCAAIADGEKAWAQRVRWQLGAHWLERLRTSFATCLTEALKQP